MAADALYDPRNLRSGRLKLGTLIGLARALPGRRQAGREAIVMEVVGPLPGEPIAVGGTPVVETLCHQATSREAAKRFISFAVITVRERILEGFTFPAVAKS
jgi:hypothetical protein